MFKRLWRQHALDTEYHELCVRELHGLDSRVREAALLLSCQIGGMAIDQEIHKKAQQGLEEFATQYDVGPDLLHELLLLHEPGLVQTAPTPYPEETE